MATNFADILAKITTAGQIVQAAEPAIQQFSTDHTAGTQQLLLITGAAVAAETTDTQVQTEAMQSAQLASTLVPLVFSIFSLFKKKSVPAVQQQAGTQPSVPPTGA